MTESAGEQTPYIRASQLYAIAFMLDAAGLALLLLQARYGLSGPPANRGVLLLTVCVPFITLLVLLVMPGRVALKPETRFPRCSPVVRVNLGLSVGLSLLTLLLVSVSGSFDSFAGFAVFLAIVAGYHLREGLRQLWLARL
jgi:hypothetical protein